MIAFAGAYARARERYCPHEDGQAGRRVVDIVFRGATHDYDVRSDFSDGRTSVLIHLGGMRRNGITSAGLSLLDNMDHDRFDVSVSYPHQPDRDHEMVTELIHPRVRLFPQSGDVIGGRIRVRLLGAMNVRLPGGDRVLLRGGNTVMRDEWTRAFGASQFEHVIDFSGYWPYWIKLLANRNAGSFAIWLHNDVQAEVSNRNRPRTVRARLKQTRALYCTADQLVSVSGALNEINRVALAAWAPAERFTTAPNTINAERIRRLAREPSPVPLVGITARRPSDGSPRPTTFVTAGRLSPEKNHERLVRAFALVRADHRTAHLVILGSGPHLERLRALIADLALGDAVTMAGHEANPYPVMARSDCFVLSSDYEGQPMALLEALVLGLPIVTTDFGSVRGVLPTGAGAVVARDAQALAEGMRAFLRGSVGRAPFDPDAYNRQAMQQFYRAIGAD
jgi:glycosyltransferase involved in cell wall biosynthesis